MRLEVDYQHLGHLLHEETLNDIRRHNTMLEVPYWHPFIRAVGRRMIKWGAWLMNLASSDNDAQSIHIHVISSFSQ
jgi:hypothetical protein